MYFSAWDCQGSKKILLSLDSVQTAVLDVHSKHVLVKYNIYLNVLNVLIFKRQLKSNALHLPS